jgi:hypothetical protein
LKLQFSYREYNHKGLWRQVKSPESNFSLWIHRPTENYRAPSCDWWMNWARRNRIGRHPPKQRNSIDYNKYNK